MWNGISMEDWKIEREKRKRKGVKAVYDAVKRGLTIDQLKLGMEEAIADENGDGMHKYWLEGVAAAVKEVEKTRRMKKAGIIDIYDKTFVSRGLSGRRKVQNERI